MSVYVGIDVHRKRSQIDIVDDAGHQQRNRNVPNDPAELVPILGDLPAGTAVAFEAAYGWGWLVDLLDELELEPHLVHPSRCKAIASARLKNDKVDARTLAHLLRANLLPEAWIAPQPVRDLRARPPRQAHRHRGDRPQAAGPLLPHPHPAGAQGHTTIGEGLTAGRARNTA
jgi:transposase